MSEVLDVEATESILGTVRIPEQPQVLMEIHAIVQSDEPDMSRVARAVEKDVGLAALVLRTVNSPLFGARVEVRSIRHATMLLGLTNISNVVTALVLRRCLENRNGQSPQDFWESPVNVALAAASLARRFGEVSADEAYMLGLFHDCGQALLLERFPDYPQALSEAGASVAAGRAATEPEDQRHRTNHAVVGYLVSRRWGLPRHISAAILNHHQVSERLADARGAPDPECQLLALLKMAEHVEQCYRGLDAEPEWQRLQEPVLEYLGLSEPDFDEWCDDVVELLDSG